MSSENPQNLPSRRQSSQKSVLTRLANSPVWLIQKVKKVISLTLKQPGKVFNNRWTTITSFVAIFGGFFADQIGTGYIIVSGILLLLLAIGVWQEASKLEFYTKRQISLPVVFSITNAADSKNALRLLFNVIEDDPQEQNHRQNLAKYLNIVEEDLIFEYNGNIFDPEPLKDFLKISRYKLERLKTKTPKSTAFEIAYIGPIAVAILVGTLFANDEVRLFQYNKSSGNYSPIIKIYSREHKQHIQNHEKFSVVQSTSANINPGQPFDNLVVAINVSSHKVNMQSACQSYQRDIDIIHLQAKNNGTIETHEDWLQYVREIYKVLNDAQQNSYKEIKLVYSMPVILGLALGLATQNYWPIQLTHYDSDTGNYKNVLKMNDISYYF